MKARSTDSNGMFAFAVWDDAAQRLSLAADPFGEKPLYYALDGDRLVFASEIKALLLDDGVQALTDEQAVANFLARGVMPPTSRSFFRGIHRLPAAHLLTFSNGSVDARRYWTPRLIDVPGRYPDAVALLRDLLKDSIRLRLRSDVPVGTSLSGGIDSSTVVMLSSELAGDHTRHAFTARFPGFERDEWSYASEVAQRAGVVEHHSVEPRAEEALADLPTLVRDHEEPVGSLSVYAQWRVMRCAKEAGVTVLLDGQGGDELFGGYVPTIGWALRSMGLQTLAREVADSPDRARLLARSLAVDHLPAVFRRGHRRVAASPYASASAVEATTRAPLPPVVPSGGRRNVLQRQLLAQSFETSLPSLLRYADRSSMAWSREARLPYLDRRIAELAFSLPTSYLYANGVTKRILRDVARGLVPDSVLERRDKVGFEPPQQAWLNDERFRGFIAEVLLDPCSRARGLYDLTAVEDDTRRGSWRDTGAVWRALNTELWLRELVEADAAEPAAEPPTPAVA